MHKMKKVQDKAINGHNTYVSFNFCDGGRC